MRKLSKETELFDPLASIRITALVVPVGAVKTLSGFTPLEENLFFGPSAKSKPKPLCVESS
jgi:hypothetical protein